MADVVVKWFSHPPPGLWEVWATPVGLSKAGGQVGRIAGDQTAVW
jgi:hypothetical protein